MQNQMKKFTNHIVEMMKDEKLFAPQGGPIILSQVYSMIVLIRGYYFSNFFFFSYSLLKHCGYFESYCNRLKMSIAWFKQHSKKAEQSTSSGQRRWRSGSRPVFHGSCASKQMLLKKW